MHSLKYLFGVLAVLLLMHGSAFAQTATATSTATATAVTATPASTPSPNGTVFSGVTNFGYWGTVSKSNGFLGGYVVQWTATAALFYGQVVIPDTANANSVVVAAGSDTNPVGVIVGCVGATSASPQPGVKFFCNPAAGQKALVQTSGIAQVVCDRALAIGTKVMASPNQGGMVTAYSAGTVDEQIGVLMTACTASGTANMLVYK